MLKKGGKNDKESSRNQSTQRGCDWMNLPPAPSGPFSLPKCTYIPGKNIRAGNHSLLQGIFPTPKFNPDLLHCRQILYQLSHQGIQRYKSNPHNVLNPWGGLFSPLYHQEFAPGLLLIEGLQEARGLWAQRG